MQYSHVIWYSSKINFTEYSKSVSYPENDRLREHKCCHRSRATNQGSCSSLYCPLQSSMNCCTPSTWSSDAGEAMTVFLKSLCITFHPSYRRRSRFGLIRLRTTSLTVTVYWVVGEYTSLLIHSLDRPGIDWVSRLPLTANCHCQ